MQKYVYFFGGGKAEGKGDMKDTLGGKGAGLAEMTNVELPVPPGFTISTDVCRIFYDNKGQVGADIQKQIDEALAKLEGVTEQKLGSTDRPLLVSVRSGAKFSMPGMMDTILNLGLNETTTKALAARTGNERFAWDSYRRFIQMYGAVVLQIEKGNFDEIFDHIKEKANAKLDTDIPVSSLQQLVKEYKALVKQKTKSDFPDDPRQQLQGAINAVFGSWKNNRAIHYRRMNKISEDLGTAVNVQTMVFGNMGNTSGTGVGFTRNPSTGEKEFYGEFLINAQGEDVVAGIRTPTPIRELGRVMPECYKQLRDITDRLERHYRDMQDFEFTIQENRLYMLQTRNGKRTGKAAVKIASDMVKENLISAEDAIMRVEPAQLDQLLHPVLDPKANVKELVQGLPASPGAVSGRIVFSAEDAVEAVEREKDARVVLVRKETVPDDIHGMEVAVGILTARGGMTSHAAVVARGMGKCCVVGAESVKIDERKKVFSVGTKELREGDWITLEGSTGKVFEGKVPTMEPDPTSGDFAAFMGMADKIRRLGIRANADIPRDAEVARKFGAEGIGLCRTEHMFFAEDRLPHVQKMILSDTEVDRREHLNKLLPFQRADFEGLFHAMDGLPVTIRLLDPPLHEFLPKREELMVEIAVLRAKNAAAKEIQEKEKLLQRVEQLHEFNPMLGHRGCRLGITYPEISEMQCRAIFEAACKVQKEGKTVKPEIMIPLVGLPKELVEQKAIVDRVAQEVFGQTGVKVAYTVGTMIELPRAVVVADKIAETAEFFSFGTNDLTQTAFGFSRDDAGKIIADYMAKGILKADPFQELDREGVGRLMQMGVEKGRSTRANLKIGICGEHGGDPSSIEFCDLVGLDYVSCSPYRVPIARLAAAQSVVARKSAGERGRTV
jgi:pyruvate,orthophosphate dikinase